MQLMLQMDPIKRLTAEQCLEHPYFNGLREESSQTRNKIGYPEDLKDESIPKKQNLTEINDSVFIQARGELTSQGKVEPVISQRLDILQESKPSISNTLRKDSKEFLKGRHSRSTKSLFEEDRAKEDKDTSFNLPKYLPSRLGGGNHSNAPRVPAVPVKIFENDGVAKKAGIETHNLAYPPAETKLPEMHNVQNDGHKSINPYSGSQIIKDLKDTSSENSNTEVLDFRPLKTGEGKKKRTSNGTIAQQQPNIIPYPRNRWKEAPQSFKYNSVNQDPSVYETVADKDSQPAYLQILPKIGTVKL